MQVSGGERCERCLWQIQRAERVAVVDKIEVWRKPDDFIGYRNRGYIVGNLAFPQKCVSNWAFFERV